MKKSIVLFAALWISLTALAQDFNYDWHFVDANTTVRPVQTRVKGDTVYILSHFNQTTIDANPYAGTDLLTDSTVNVRKAFISKFTTDGAYVESHRLMYGYGLNIADFQIDANNQIVVVGDLSATADFDPSGAVSSIYSGASAVSFCAFYTSSGAYTGHFEYNYNGANNVYFYSSVVSATNQLYLGGSFQGTIDADFTAGTDSITSQGNGADCFILKVDLNNQTYAWSKGFGGTNYDAISRLAMNNNRVFMSGEFSGTADFDPNAGVSNEVSFDNNYWSFLNVLDENGTYINSLSYGGILDDIYSFGLQVDTDNSVYMLTEYNYPNDSIDLDPSAGQYLANTSHGNYGGYFLSKYDANLNFMWSKSLTSDGEVYIDSEYPMLALGANHISVASNFYGDAMLLADNSTTDTLAPTPLNYDMAIVALEKTDGAAIRTILYTGDPYILGGYSYSEPLSLVADADDNVYCLGYFEKDMDFNPFDGATNYDNGYYNTFFTKLNWVDYTSVPEVAFTAFEIFPNPSEGQFSVRSESKIALVEITYLNGQKIAESHPESTFFQFDLTQQKSGVYLVRITSENGETGVRRIAKI